MSLHVGASIPRRMSLDEFREFQFERPDHERWELIDGHPVMKTPPFVDHNRIARNLERLLGDSLEGRDPSRDAIQAVGVDLGLSAATLASLALDEGYAPEPDVAVIEGEPEEGLRIVPRTYLFAEVISSTDNQPVGRRRQRWIDVKSALYRAHASCEAVLAIRQDPIEVELQVPGEKDWTVRTLKSFEDEICLPTFGLRCAVGDLYVGTHLNPRPKRGLTP